MRGSSSTTAEETLSLAALLLARGDALAASRNLRAGRQPRLPALGAQRSGQQLGHRDHGDHKINGTRFGRTDHGEQHRGSVAGRPS